MAESGETQEQRIIRLEADLEKATRTDEAAILALMFVHENRKRISMASNILWLAKSETEDRPAVTEYLKQVERILESLTIQVERILAARRIRP